MAKKRQVNRGAAIEKAATGVMDKQARPPGVELTATDGGRGDIVGVHAADEEHANVAISLPRGMTKARRIRRAMQRLSGLKSTETARAVGAFGYAFGQYAGGVMTSMHSAFANERTARWYHNQVPVQHATEEAKAHVIEDAWDAVRAVAYGLDPRQMATRLDDTAANESMMNTVMHHAQNIRQAVLSGNIDTLIDTAYTVSKDLGFIQPEDPPEQQPQGGDGEDSNESEDSDDTGTGDPDSSDSGNPETDQDRQPDSNSDGDNTDSDSDADGNDSGAEDAEAQDSEGSGDGDADSEQPEGSGDDGESGDGDAGSDPNESSEGGVGEQSRDSQGGEPGESNESADGDSDGRPDSDTSDDDRPGEGEGSSGDAERQSTDSRLNSVHESAAKAERDRQAEAAAAKAENERAATAKSKASSSGAGRQDNHNWVMIEDVACVEAELHHSVKGTLEQFMQSTYHLSDDTGGFASDYIGEMNIGNLDVFYEERREKGNIVIAVDCSGSMGAMTTTEIATAKHRWYDSVTSSYLAWQSAMALSKAFNEAEVIGYHGQDEHAVVGTVLPGMRPWTAIDGRDKFPDDANAFTVSGGGTPECTALLVMQEMLAGRFDGSAGVIITDGWPNDIGHTSDLAYKMARSGMAFAIVVVGNDQQAKSFRTSDGLGSLRRNLTQQRTMHESYASRYQKSSDSWKYYMGTADELTLKIAELSRAIDRGSIYPMEAFVEIESISDLPKLSRVLEFLRERSGQ